MDMIAMNNKDMVAKGDILYWRERRFAEDSKGKHTLWRGEVDCVAEVVGINVVGSSYLVVMIVITSLPTFMARPNLSGDTITRNFAHLIDCSLHREVWPDENDRATKILSPTRMPEPRP